ARPRPNTRVPTPRPAQSLRPEPPAEACGQHHSAVLHSGMVPPEANPDWRSHLLERNSEIRRVVLESRRIAVLGIKLPDSYQPAYYVPQYMQHAGYEIVPVPVYYPDAREILGVPVARRLSEIEGAIDIVNVF